MIMSVVVSESHQHIETLTVPSWIRCFVTNIHNDPDLKQELEVIPCTACYSFTAVTLLQQLSVTPLWRLKVLFFPSTYSISCESWHAIAWSWDVPHNLPRCTSCFRILRIRLSTVFNKKKPIIFRFLMKRTTKEVAKW